MKTYVMGLCAKRHPYPVEDCIFPQWIDHDLTMDQLERMADKKIPEDCSRLAVYVSGIMVGILAVVAACSKRNISVTAYVYDPRKKKYNRQEVLSY